MELKCNDVSNHCAFGTEVVHFDGKTINLKTIFRKATGFAKAQSKCKIKSIDAEGDNQGI